MTYFIDGVTVRFNWIDDSTEQEAKAYVDYARDHLDNPEYLKTLTIAPTDDGMIDIDYELQGPKFERIRRITGYLSGDLSSWNDSKRDEERDRVKMTDKDFNKMCFEIAYEKYLDYKSTYKKDANLLEKFLFMLRYEGLGWWIAGAAFTQFINYILI